jgi:hypothetical protein
VTTPVPVTPDRVSRHTARVVWRVLLRSGSPVDMDIARLVAAAVLAADAAEKRAGRAAETRRRVRGRQRPPGQGVLL